jgi:hypothetical protein
MHVYHAMNLSTAIFQSENLNGRDHLENVGADWKIILKWTIKIGCEDMD